MGRPALAFGLAVLLMSGVASAQDAAERYVVDAAQSDVHWLVYKAGALARLGHNHTIAVGDLSGDVAVNRDRLGEVAVQPAVFGCRPRRRRPGAA